MLDLKKIRDNPEVLRKALDSRKSDLQLDNLLSLDEEWRKLKTELDKLKENRNRVSVEISEIKKRGKSAEEKIKEMQGLTEEIKKFDISTNDFEAKIKAILLTIPNIPHASVPLGKDEDDNSIVRKFGEPRKFDFQPKAHWELGPELGILDFERGSKIAGSRFTFTKGMGSRMERALVSFMLDMHRKNGYLEVFPPLLVTEKTMTGTGQLPKFEIELYRCERDGLYLIPTAEVPVTNMHADEILEESALPLHYTAYTPCFRREAGAYGKDIKGMIRQHQFNKVELVKIATPENSYKELELMTNNAEQILQKLELPYVVKELCTADLGFAAAKTYDIEVWIPSQDRYREISSCSNCEDFQARRANIRYWHKGKPEFVHTLNGSGLAVGRTLVAIMENCQQKDGTIIIPKALRPYLENMERIEKAGKV